MEVLQSSLSTYLLSSDVHVSAAAAPSHDTQCESVRLYPPDEKPQQTVVDVNAHTYE